MVLTQRKRRNAQERLAMHELESDALVSNSQRSIAMVSLSENYLIFSGAEG
jgi:hypothetical protein